MSWVIHTIAKIILSVLCKLFNVISDSFITIFGINIGAKFPRVGGKSMSLISVLNSYGKTADSIFDALFPLSGFKKLFAGMAVTIATALLIMELLKAIAAPATRGKKQHPVTSVAKYAIAIPGIFLSYRIFICLEYLGNEFYVKFGEAAIKGIAVPSGKTVSDIFTGGVGNILETGLTLGTTLGELVTGTGVITGIAAAVFNLMVVWLVFTNFLKLIIEVMERYVVMGVLFYTSPLPFASLASEETNHIFSAWLKMALSQMLLLITNGMFLSVFLSGMLKLGITSGNGLPGAIKNVFTLQGFTPTSQITWAVYMLMLVAWLLFAQRFDSYLNSLGLSTAKTGGGLASSVRAGAIAVGGLAMSMGKGYAGSATRKNVAAQPFGLNRAKTQFQGGVDAMEKKVRSSFGLDTSGPEKRQGGMNAQRAVADGFKEAGRHDLSKKLWSDNELKGMDAKNGMMISAKDNKALQESIQNGSDHRLGRNKEGVLQASWNDENGKKTTLSYGEKQGSYIGKQDDMPVYATGSAATLDKIMSKDGESKTKQGAIDWAKQNGLQAGIDTKTGEVMIHNPSEGRAMPFAAEGSTNIENPYSTGTGFVAGASIPTPKTFDTFEHADQVEKTTQSVIGTMNNKGYASAAQALSSPSGSISGTEVGDALNVNPRFATIMDASNAQMVKPGVMSLKNDGGGEIQVSYFDSEAAGSLIQNGQRAPMKAVVTDFGYENATGIAFYNAQSGIDQEAKTMENFFQSIFGEDEIVALSPAENTLADFSLNGTSIDTHEGIAIPFENSDGTVIGEMTYEGIARNLEGNWIHGAKGISFRLTDEGRELYGEAMGAEDIEEQLGFPAPIL